MPRIFGKKQRAEIAGEVRQCQLLSTFGIGSIIDFVQDTVMVAGTDNWDSDEDWEVRRLFNNNLQMITGVEYFLAPKTAVNVNFIKSQDIESFIFPRKLYCPVCKHIIDAGELRNQRRKHRCFMPSESKTNKPCGGHLVASRFVIVCPNGHIEDFPYSWWVHHGKECTKSKNPRITMFNIDNRSDIDSLFVKCDDCQAWRSMANAFSKNAFAGENGYRCSGRYPHLGKDYQSECNETMTARLRSSSSVYFPVAISALTIPPWSREEIQLVEAEYGELTAWSRYGDQAMLDFINRRILSRVKKSCTATDLLAAYKLVKEQKNSAKVQSEADILAAEYDVLCREMVNEDEYVACEVRVPDDFERYFDSITVIDKLTVINALIGFTRVSPWNGELRSGCLAPLSVVKKNWLPAVKQLGEGIFFKFNQDVLSAWVELVGDRYQDMEMELAESFLENTRFSPQYVALHTFAHLLIRQLANDCGYSASSIKEKIYSTYMDDSDRPKMAGVLIYLAVADSEGSLGGLISIASDSERMRIVLKNMLRKAQWCSADPFCSNARKQGFHSLNYAACHDCVLLPETSCEFRNVLLDRVAIVGMPENLSLGLMGEAIMSMI
ncbi:DUF1998 domain-containing protein, partial [uncultured Acetatifactor sp.]